MGCRLRRGTEGDLPRKDKLSQSNKLLSYLRPSDFLFMKWKGRTLRMGKAVYKFKSEILQCRSVKERIIAVLERNIIFIEKDGEIVKYPTHRITSAGIMVNGVIFTEENSRKLRYITHPYDRVYEFDLLPEVSFEIASAHGKRFVLLYENSGKKCLGIYKGCPEEPVLLLAQEYANVQSVCIRGIRYAVVQKEGIIVCSLRKKKNEKVPGREIGYTPVSGRVDSIVPLRTSRGAYFLINGSEVISEYGLVFNLACIPAEDQVKYVTAKGLAKVRIIEKGKYRINELARFFQYASKGERLFGAAMPSLSMHRILKLRSAEEGSLERLFTREIMGLPRRLVERISAFLEKMAHIISHVHEICTPLFGWMAARNKPINKKRAYLFMMLSTGNVPKKVLEYEIFTYKEDLLNKSQNAAYLLLKNDQTENLRRKVQAKFGSVLHTLEDPEHIKDVPLRLKNSGVIEECKRLLSGHEVCDFLFDVYDTENRRKKAFIFSIISSVGRGVFLLNRNHQVNVFQVPQLKVFLKKNNNVVGISDISEYDSMWPSFHFAVATALSIPNRPYISTCHIEVMTSRSVMALGGSIFGFGLKTTVGHSNMTVGEKLSLSQSLILSLSKSHDSFLIASTILGNSFIIKGTGNKDHASIILLNIRSPTAPSHLLMWSVLALGILYMGLDDLFAKQALVEYMQRSGVIFSPNSLSRRTYYDKYHRVAAAFSLSYIMLGSRVREYVRLPDRTCEIIVNGLVHMKSASDKISSLLIEKHASSTPINRFYSALMAVLVKGETHRYPEALKEARRSSMSVEDAYSIAGEIFAYGLLFIPDENRKIEELFIAEITSLLYWLERFDGIHSVLMDYVLLACCLVLNSTGNLCVLGTCKRLLDSLKCIDSLEKITDFSTAAGNYRDQFGMRFGRIQHIKMCLSLLVPGCGSMRIQPTPESIAYIVTSFYPDFPLTPEDQDAFQVIRHFYLLSLAPVEDSDSIMLNKDILQKIRSELSTVSSVEKKAAVDIITSYFENHSVKSFTTSSIESLVTNLYADLL